MSAAEGMTVLWFDGACRGNPGPMAGGAVVQTGTHRIVLRGRVGHGTNNEAEYDGLLMGLRHCLAEGVQRIDVRGDSQLVIRQLEGRYKVRAHHLRPLYAEARELLDRFDEVRLSWVPRAQNGEADRAANEALDHA